MQTILIILFFIIINNYSLIISLFVGDSRITLLKLAAWYKDVRTRTCGAVVAIKRTPRRFFPSARLSPRLVGAVFFFCLANPSGPTRGSRFHLADKCARICVTQSPMITKINRSDLARILTVANLRRTRTRCDKFTAYILTSILIT